MMMKRKLILPGLLVLALCLGVHRNAMASSIWYVNGMKGNDTHNCKAAASACKTIKHAISHSSSGDSIIVAPATYKENLSIAFNLMIVGSSARTTIIDGGQSASVFTIKAAAHVTLAGLTVRNGLGLSSGGGGINNAGTLMIINTTVSGNSSYDTVMARAGLGGGIYNSGTLTVMESTISGNTVSRFRVGAEAAGGGIYNTGKLTITNTTLSGNQAVDYWPAEVPYGGGIANESGSAMISNATLSQNGALIYVPGVIVGTFGGGIYNKSATAPTIQNSILANNAFGGNCNGRVASLGHNLSSDSTCNFRGPGDLNGNSHSNLGPLQNNGGPTQTMALLPGSYAMNAGNPNGCTDGSGHRLLVDQRGDPRPKNRACDMGAYNH